jgi:hypothetical protein
MYHLTPRAPYESAASRHIEHRAERSNSAMHAVHSLDGDHHGTHILPECSALVPERPERSAQRINAYTSLSTKGGTVHARCNMRHGNRLAPRREWPCHVEGIAQPRRVREEARVGTKIEEEEEAAREG